MIFLIFRRWRVDLFLSVLILSFTAISCQEIKKPEPTTIFQTETDKYSFSIQESNLKLDPENKAQCANYFSYRYNTNDFELYAGDLRNVISILLDTKIINISPLPKNMYGKFFNIIYEGPVTSERNKKIIEKIIHLYQLELKEKLVYEKGWSLYVKDQEKADIYSTEENEPSEMTVEQFGFEQLVIKNAPLSILAGQLQHLYGKRINVDGDDSLIYTLTIRLPKNFPALKENLKDNFGLGLQPIDSIPIKKLELSP